MRLCWRSCRIKGGFGFVCQMADITAGFSADENDPLEKEESLLVRKERVAGIMSVCRQSGK